ncbi:MAG: serine/threonine-protein kinase [Cyanobacteria bacterium P01_C01_bin.72]
MSDYPDLTSYGYQIEAELGRNREGGRITWQGREIATKNQVVIKQFCFAQANSSWSGYKAYAQEIAILQKLSHPSIPQYLDSIETDNGFCLIQEYVFATSCSDFRVLTKSEVKQVAEKILDILIYLQQQTPPVLHRDLSTANILLDECLNVYLIDFGFASLGSNEVAASSVFLGTPGFIAPEQIIKPTAASDIYSLGVVLVCLLTRQDISEVRTWATTDDPYQLNLEEPLPDLESEFLSWLIKMTNSKVSQRFADAWTAKQALKEIDLPEVCSPDAVLATERTSPQSLKPKIVGGVAISGVTLVATWGSSFAASRVELSLVTVAIAILATAAIVVTQAAAATIVSSAPETKFQGIILSTVIPVILVCASGLIWGLDEAVLIAATIAISEILLLSYFWLQLPSKSPNFLAKIGICCGAMMIGIILGGKLI